MTNFFFILLRARMYATGIGNEQADRRRDERDHERIDDGAQFGWIGEKAYEVIERDVHLLVGERIEDDDEHGDDDEKEQKDGVGDPQRFAGKAQSHFFLSSACFRESLIFSLGMMTETRSFSFQRSSVANTKSSSSSPSVRTLRR